MKNSIFRYGLMGALFAVSCVCLSVAVWAEEETQGDVFSLETCPVSGERLDAMAEPVLYNHEGREIRFCCAGCIERFAGSTELYLSKVDREMIAQQKEYYPLSTCPVSGSELGEMGEPMDIVVNNRLVRLCCGGCEKKVRENPAEYISKIDAAVIEQQTADYPFRICMISGERLGLSKDREIEKVVAMRLLRFCCSGCETMFNENPAKYLHMLDTGELDVSESEGSHSKDEGGHEGH